MAPKPVRASRRYQTERPGRDSNGTGSATVRGVFELRDLLGITAADHHFASHPAVEPA